MEVPGAEEVNIEMQSSGLSVVVVGVWEIVLDFLQQSSHTIPAMKLIDVQVIGNDQKAIPAQMATCDQCNGDFFRILVINGHNHLECKSCGESYCQGGCDHGCKDDSCDQSHCAKCGSHMVGGYLPPGTVCDTCKMEGEICRKCNSPLENGRCTDETCPYSDHEQTTEFCPNCGSGLFNEKGECQKCGL